MSVEQQGDIRGASPQDRAAETAWRLAELGVTAIAITPAAPGGDGWRELHARDTDLPGEILARLDAAGSDAAVELICPELPLRFTITHQTTHWRTSETELAQQLSRPSADS